MPNSILVVAAHPDDEAFGCGGTMANLADQGNDVHVAFLADGVSARGAVGAALQAELTARRAAARAAADILGVRSVTFSDLPDNRMDTVALLDVIGIVEALVAQHEPDTVITHHGNDLNIDHQLTHQAVVTACRPQPGHLVRTLLSFEVPSSTEWQVPGASGAFAPNWWSNIATTLERKLLALGAYAAELRPWPHPRSPEAVEHLARWRGASVGMEAAEAFTLERHLT
jgi:N-acetylglucosamine malate deacetylase 1